MTRWEEGKINHDDEIELFQDLVDSGFAWELPGRYRRHAEALIRAGLVTRSLTPAIMDNRDGYR